MIKLSRALGSSNPALSWQIQRGVVIVSIVCSKNQPIANPPNSARFLLLNINCVHILGV